MTRAEIEKILNMLRSEIKEVTGCTEVAGIALSCARAAKLLKEESGKNQLPSDFRLELKLSENVFRNASTAVSPRIKKKGVAPAAAFGLFAKGRGLNLFSEPESSITQKAGKLLTRENWLKVTKIKREGVYIMALLESGSVKSYALIDGKHDLVVRSGAGKGPDNPSPPDPGPYNLKGFDEIKRIADKRYPVLEKEVLSFISKQGAIAKKTGFKNTRKAVAALIKMRMLGENIAVQTITGSGNQGIFLALPLYAKYLECGEKFLPAALFSLLTQIYLTGEEGRISEDCGFSVKASPSLAAGLAYFRGASLPEIRELAALAKNSLKEMLCEGAEISCALKAEAGLDAAEIISGI